MEHIDDDALDDDALSRLGVEEYSDTHEPVLQATHMGNLTAALGDASDYLHVDGNATVTGDLIIDGSINNIAWVDNQAQLEDAVRRIEFLESEIESIRTFTQAERWTLEERIYKLEQEKENG